MKPSRRLATKNAEAFADFGLAGQLLSAERIGGKRIRLIGVGGSNVVPPENQSDLFNRTDEKRTRLAKAVDELPGKLRPERSSEEARCGEVAKYLSYHSPCYPHDHKTAILTVQHAHSAT